jgi:hypothetical protein
MPEAHSPEAPLPCHWDFRTLTFLVVRRVLRGGRCCCGRLWFLSNTGQQVRLRNAGWISILGGTIGAYRLILEKGETR